MKHFCSVLGFAKFLCFIGFVVANPAHAGGLFLPGIMYRSDAIQQDTIKAGSSRLDLNLTGGILVSPEFLFGLKYLSLTTTVAGEVATLTSQSVSEIYGIGLSAGYVAREGLTFLATYFLNPEKKTTDSTGDTTWVGKNCISLDIGLQFKVKSIGFGPLVSYIKYAYDKQETALGTTELFGTYEDTLIAPQFALWFRM